MRSRSFHRKLPLPFLFLAAWLCVAAAGRTTAAARPPQRPNVLFIAVDDLNDWIGVLGGYPGLKTPNIDRLSRRGVLFTRAYCAAPACNPSRTALLTGRHPASTGVYLNGQPWRPVLPDTVTLPEHFRANGYEVPGGGKIFHYNDPKVWDTFFNRPADPQPANRPVNGIPRAAHFDWSPVQAADDDMSDAKTVSWAEEYLAQKRAKPFFLAVGLFRPHLPWYVPQKYFDRYPLAGVRLPVVNPEDLDDVPPAGRRMANADRDHRNVVLTNNWEKAVQGYLASISFADGQIGRLLDALDRSPHAENTIIVFWGDHGWHLGEKRHWRKFALWEEATRVPLVIATPEMRRAGMESPRTVSLLDVYPTLVELCGLSPREGLDGRSLAPLLQDPAMPWDRPVVTTHGRLNHAVRSERFRYIRYADGSEELYDHQSDPLEWTNLARDPGYAGVKSDLAEHLPKVNAPDAPRRNEGGEE